MRGRKPPGPEFVKRLEGSATSKERAELILRTLSGELSLQQASEILGISTQRLHVLRQQAVQALVDSLEPQPAGRPSKQPETVVSCEAEAEIARLQRELQAARLQAEIATILPGRQGAASAKKKVGRSGDRRGRGGQGRPRGAGSGS